MCSVQKIRQERELQNAMGQAGGFQALTGVFKLSPQESEEMPSRYLGEEHSWQRGGRCKGLEAGTLTHVLQC